MPRQGKVSPLVQMHEKGYAEKYQGQGLPVHENGIIFNPKTRNIVNVEMEKISPFPDN
jgi:hypothetical protein